MIVVFILEASGIIVLPASFCLQVNEADGRDWWWEKLGLILVGWVKL